MLKFLGKLFIHVAILTVAAHLSMVVGVRIWPDMKEKPPAELFTAGLIGAFVGIYLFYSVKDKFGWGTVPSPAKTDPVLGPAPKPIKTYEEWKGDLDKIDGQTGIEEFLEKWSEVPRTEKPKPGALSDAKQGPSEGQEIPNRPGLPENVVGWIDKHYERASQLWNHAHPGQWERRHEEERERWARDRAEREERHEREMLRLKKEAQERSNPRP